MTHQVIFTIVFLLTIGIFGYTASKIAAYFRLTRPFPIGDIPKRIGIMLKVAIGQTKIFRFPLVGLAHALVFWGFMIVAFGSIEMVIDGLFGVDKSLAFLGWFYDFMMASGDIFGLLVGVSIIAFLVRRLAMHIHRFKGIEMKKISKIDANLALLAILFLMVSLLGMNTYYLVLHPNNAEGVYPVSRLLMGWFVDVHHVNFASANFWFHFYWWAHIVTIFVFANALPYSKHFHVFMSVPNVFLSRLQPLGKLDNMESVTREIKLMLDPQAAAPTADTEEEIERFGVKDIQDITWKNYLDSLSCTECGRCTSVCPANITGKLLSPRKIIMDTRARMKEIGPLLVQQGKDYDDGRALIRDYITEEELWACTTCNACAQECPININHPTLIVDMRRYLFMEESAAPGELNSMFTNIENNGAPWQFPPEDRLKWATEVDLEVPVMAELQASGRKPEYLVWIGSSGAFDDRYKKVSREFVKILNHLGIDYGLLGEEETDTADSARRAGNEMLYQMQTFQIIETFKMYEVEKIITCCPHDYNTFKNEYPDFGGNYQVWHHSQFLQKLISEGTLKPGSDKFASRKITFHDPCYLGRGNGEYEAPRRVIESVAGTPAEMQRNRSFALCCGAGGGQMFKEAEKGNKEVFIERIEDAIEIQADIVVTACPFCMVMMTDGIKYKNKEETMQNLDIAELVSQSLGL
ncbi:MAG: (Fe-S)-binding protein [Clostridia bacterium]|nr:(Fe-S)-binding protein [Clostridia bacterium]